MEVLESDLRRLHGAALGQFLSLSFKSPLTVTRIPNMEISKIHKELLWHLVRAFSSLALALFDANKLKYVKCKHF